MSQVLATDNQTDQRENYCKLLIWWKSPDEIYDQELLRKIMNLGTWEMWQWAWQNFTEESFVNCLTDARVWRFLKRLLALLAHPFIHLSHTTRSKK